MSMSAEHRVLVVGTTSDYVDWLRRAIPDQCLFLTDEPIRLSASEASPCPEEELLSEFRDFEAMARQVSTHLDKYGQRLDGIVCYDCESMEPAAHIARRLGLRYPTMASIETCRNKHACKSLWRGAGVPCPEARLLRTAAEVRDFVEESGRSCVLKPQDGSGSELVFRVRSPGECKRAMELMQEGLERTRGLRLYRRGKVLVLAETWVEGPEYSCDFVALADRVEIIRLTRKIKDSAAPFGTIMAYGLCAMPTPDFDQAGLEAVLLQAARTLSLSGIVTMVDFIAAEDGIQLLEMTPRPGGDCLPQLLRRAAGLDMLVLAVDVALGREVRGLNGQATGDWIGLRLHAGREGRLLRLDARGLDRDSRVRERFLLRGPGHQIVMPPRDYESWYLGHVIFQADKGDPEAQCREIRDLVKMEIAP